MGGHIAGSDVKGFGKCCIQSEMCEGDMLRDGSEEDGNVRSECEEGEGNACEDGDREIDW